MSRRRETWIGTSWKMNKTRSEAVDYLAGLCAWRITSDVDATIAVFPPYTALTDCAAVLRASQPGAGTSDPRNGSPGSQQAIQLGAQNMHWLRSGAQTGEISSAMLLDCGVGIVELGHFERRGAFGETDDAVNLKLRAALSEGLQAIVCVGDSSREHRYGVAAESVARQVKIALHAIPAAALPSIVLAYEPEWAIGDGGEGATVDDIAAMQAVIRSAVDDVLGAGSGEVVRVVYGGSVDPTNAHRYAEVAGIDGLFVGRAALDAKNLVAIVERFCAVTRSTLDHVVCTQGEIA